MKAFYEQYKEFSILPPEVAALPWTHNYILLEKIKDRNKRLWYANECLKNGWAKSVLLHQIELNLYENFIYLDKEQLTPSFIADFNKQNETSITISKLPTLIVFNDNEVEIIYYSLKEEDVKTIDFEGVR